MGREHMQLWLQKSSEGGLYGHEESWQDQEESPGEEKGRRQEEEVAAPYLRPFTRPEFSPFPQA